ncbi:hypothetical protein T484DRAFT_1797525, partial [Baffinella frigidus]
MVAFSGLPPRGLHTIGAHLTTSATPVRLSGEELIETTAEKADPESLIGVLQTRDVFADARVRDAVGRSQVTPTTIEVSISSADLQMWTRCSVNSVNGVTEGCSVELEPFWVLFATPRNNTAVVAIALDGKQVILGSVSLHRPHVRPKLQVPGCVLKFSASERVWRGSFSAELFCQESGRATGGITHGDMVLETDAEVLGVSVAWRPSFATSSRSLRLSDSQLSLRFDSFGTPELQIASFDVSYARDTHVATINFTSRNDRPYVDVTCVSGRVLELFDANNEMLVGSTVASSAVRIDFVDDYLRVSAEDCNVLTIKIAPRVVGIVAFLPQSEFFNLAALAGPEFASAVPVTIHAFYDQGYNDVSDSWATGRLDCASSDAAVFVPRFSSGCEILFSGAELA